MKLKSLKPTCVIFVSKSQDQGVYLKNMQEKYPVKNLEKLKEFFRSNTESQFLESFPEEITHLCEILNSKENEAEE